MKAAVTIRLDDDLERRLDEICERSGKTRSEIVREALRRQLALMQFDQLRERTLPFAEAQGLLTDEDIFRIVS
jgi:predicted transcriptional regulator